MCEYLYDIGFMRRGWREEGRKGGREEDLCSALLWHSHNSILPLFSWKAERKDIVCRCFQS